MQTREHQRAENPNKNFEVFGNSKKVEPANKPPIVFANS